MRSSTRSMIYVHSVCRWSSCTKEVGGRVTAVCTTCVTLGMPSTNTNTHKQRNELTLSKKRISPSLLDVGLIVGIQDLLQLQFGVFTQKFQPARQVMVAFIGDHHWLVVLFEIIGLWQLLQQLHNRDVTFREVAPATLCDEGMGPMSCTLVLSPTTT